MSSICTKCGALLPPGVRFCTVCGAPVPAESAARPQTPEPQTPAGPALCPSCGNPLKPGVRFCTACGANLTNAEPIRPQPRQSAVHPSAAAAAGAAGFEALIQGERPEQGSPYRPSASTVRPQSASNPTAVRRARQTPPSVRRAHRTRPPPSRRSARGAARSARSAARPFSPGGTSARAAAPVSPPVCRPRLRRTSPWRSARSVKRAPAPACGSRSAPWQRWYFCSVSCC